MIISYSIHFYLFHVMNFFSQEGLVFRTNIYDTSVNQSKLSINRIIVDREKNFIFFNFANSKLKNRDYVLILV